MIIETQASLDDDIMNFYPQQMLLPTGVACFVDSKSLRHSPLAEHIFDIGDIKSILITSDMISVTKDSCGDWTTLKPQIMAEIMDFIISGENIIIEHPAKKTNDDTKAEIVSLLNARIRPIIQKDGGDIKFHDFQNGIVFVELQGKCVGCPYAARTLKDGVEKILQTYIAEVKSVQNISEQS